MATNTTMSKKPITILVILGAIVLLIIAVVMITKNKSKENFLGNLPSFTTKVDLQTCGSNQGNSGSNALNPDGTPSGDSGFSIPGTYQALLAPRNFGGAYGANIRYNMPSYSQQAVPADPLTLGKMVSGLNVGSGCGGSSPATNISSGVGVTNSNINNNMNNKMINNNPKTKENYPSSCSAGGYGTDTIIGGPVTQANYSAGNYSDALKSAFQGVSSDVHASSLPIGDMTVVNALGESSQPIICERLMIANRNSRLRGQGDPIRGDLPCVPISGYMRPSVQPNIDLQQGAMNVMGGIDNETTKQLADLIYRSSGNSNQTISGVDMTTQLRSSLSAGQADLQVHAY